MKNLIIASTSTIYGSEFLEYLLPELSKHFKDCKTIVFIPFARPGGLSYNAYSDKVAKAFSKINKQIVGLHTFDNPQAALQNAEGIFTGGGNTFELLHQLYNKDIINTLAQVLENGTPYLGTSAGSNIAGVSIKNTNDMPVVYPKSFKAMHLFNFNINAHYLDPIKNSKHMGETRETRIKEFHVYNNTPVLGLREGSWLSVRSSKITLKGQHTARLFLKDKTPVELEPNTLITI